MNPITPQVTIETLFDRVCIIVSELCKIPPGAVTMDDHLVEDLGMDSLQTMELLSRLSEDFEVEPDMDDVVEAVTVSDVVVVIGRAISLDASAA